MIIYLPEEFRKIMERNLKRGKEVPEGFSVTTYGNPWHGERRVEHIEIKYVPDLEFYETMKTYGIFEVFDLIDRNNKTKKRIDELEEIKEDFDNMKRIVKKLQEEE